MGRRRVFVIVSVAAAVCLAGLLLLPLYVAALVDSHKPPELAYASAVREGKHGMQVRHNSSGLQPPETPAGQLGVSAARMGLKGKAASKNLVYVRMGRSWRARWAWWTCRTRTWRPRAA